jgi:hypothetical protein
MCFCTVLCWDLLLTVCSLCLHLVGCFLPSDSVEKVAMCRDIVVCLITCMQSYNTLTTYMTTCIGTSDIVTGTTSCPSKLPYGRKLSTALDSCHEHTQRYSNELRHVINASMYSASKDSMSLRTRSRCAHLSGKCT